MLLPEVSATMSSADRIGTPADTSVPKVRQKRASAIFLIIELTDPFVGVLKLSPGPVLETLKALGT